MKSCNRLLIATNILVLLSVSSFAQAGADSPIGNPVYEKSCAKCHGKTAEGRHFGGPSLVRTTMSENELKTIIANGKGRMPKFAGKLTEDQIATLATEIKALSANPPQK